MSKFAAFTLLLFLAFSCGLLKPSNPAASNAQTISPQTQWDEVFTRSSGWTGGDVASSLVIPGGRVLWMFGDSFIGDVEGNRHVRATLVNNAIAVHPYDQDRPGKPPVSSMVRFYWGPRDESGKPTAWVRPVPKAPAAADSKTWYWPTGGGVVLPGADGGSRLVLFLIRLEKKPGDKSLWGFQVKGSAVAIIDNAKEPPESWKTRVIELPSQINQKIGAITATRQVEWGVASLYEPALDGSPGYALIYGVVSDSASNRDLVLARVRPSQLEDFGVWEFFADGQWSKSPGLASPLVNGVASELSVDKIADRNGLVHYVMVYSEPLLGDRIFVRIAPGPAGPWSEAKPVFTISEVTKSKNFFAYAAKGHAALSAPGTLLISYIVNSHDFNELADDASIYRPRFISAPLADLGI